MSRQSLTAAVTILVITILLPFSVVLAQKGKVVGHVYDTETGEPLPGANIIITHRYEQGKPIEITEKQGAAGDAEGYFVILNVDPGIYDIQATMIGYRSLVKKQVQVNIDLTTNIDFPLQTAAIEGETVEIIAEREIIRRDVSGTQEVIQTQRIEETPVVRMDEFISKIKGVELTAGEEGQGLSIRGGKIRETDVRIDGISLRDPRSENSYLSINSTSVEELQVLTGGFEAKYGRIRSGLVNAVTKEGSRDKYSISVKYDYTPGSQYKFFGTNPWSEDSWIYKVFADTNYKYLDPSDSTWKSYAMDGVPSDPELLPEGFPDDAVFRNFRGWNHILQRPLNYETMGIPDSTYRKLARAPEEKLALWKFQHPLYDFAQKPDMYVEGSITGPVPGAALPLVGEFLEQSTFLLAGKYENSQYAFPIGPQDEYIDWNSQLKITTRLSGTQKLSINGMYAEVNTMTAGRPTSFGGALVDYSSRFNFLNTTDVSVRQQGALLAGQTGLARMFNKSRLQYYDQRHIMGGVKYTENLTPRTFYTLDFQMGYSDHQITPFGFNPADTTANFVRIDSMLYVKNIPREGSPNASTNIGKDMIDFFELYGGLQAVDSSYTMETRLKGALTSQVGQHHEIETGFDFGYTRLNVNSGTWLQAQKSWTPDTWQYFTAEPISLGLYLQDKLEFEGMVANVGLRADYFNAREESYVVNHPLDKDYANFYNLVYNNLPGDFGSWERWVEYREMLDSPKGWPTKESQAHFKLSPRMGISFPITLTSKLYFNYGHFYQRPNIHFLYNRNISPGSAIVPSPGLDMARTVAFEFGYEQEFWDSYLINISAYYKDIQNEPLSRVYIDWWEEMHVRKYFPDSYRDIRGVEIRMEKNLGRFFTFWGNYDYMVASYGNTGLARVYENRLKANDEARSANVTTTQPRPTAQANFNFHTPGDFGPRILARHPLENIVMNFSYEWRDGGDQIINPNEPESEWRRIEIVDFYNLDMRASKMFQIGETNFEIVLTVQNLLNVKRLSYGNMTSSQYNVYRDSLRTEEIYTGVNRDKLGEYNRDEYAWETTSYKLRKGWYNVQKQLYSALGMEFNKEEPWRWGDNEHIDTGWYEAPLYLNPRRVLIGVRVHF